ncbi:MAG: CxxxxCH/CxxCH domain-containing protein [Bacteroidetes bacterium]|nr:CxxxxCH/CxxCH domain-containing protein [Bacteroidota bacterium]
MKHEMNILLISLLAVCLLAACSSELNDPEDLPGSPQLYGVHGEGYLLFGSSNFHGYDIRDNLGGDITGCRTCHGNEYAGGRTGQSCNASGCHVAEDGGPEACYVCHGDSYTKKIYPQEYPSHATHLEGGDYSATTIACGDCHTLPSNYEDPAHLDDATPGRAEVLLRNALASVKTNGTVGTPAYDGGGGTCANTYCHGNFTNGNNLTVAWKEMNQASCGSCHGQAVGNPLPGGSHPQNGNCSACHTGVIDANRTIIDKSLHVNGILNVFGQARRDW